MGRGILRGAGGDENLKFNFIWPNKETSIVKFIQTIKMIFDGKTQIFIT